MDWAKVTAYLYSGGNSFDPNYRCLPGETTVAELTYPITFQQVYEFPPHLRVKIYLTGNGQSTIKVSSMALTQGNKSVFIRVGGKQSYYIPPEGRWSDYFYIDDFDLPLGEWVTLTLHVYFVGQVTAPIGVMNLNPSQPGTYDPEQAVPIITTAMRAETPNILSGDVLFDLELKVILPILSIGFTPSIVKTVH